MTTLAERVTCITQHADVGFAMSLASDMGIFHALADANGPATSQQVAKTTGLKERYVREILNSVAVATLVQITENEANELVYTIEDKGVKQELQGQLAHYMSFPGILSSIYPSLKKCLPSDIVSVRYSNQVQEWQDNFNGKAAPSLVDAILKLVPGLRDRLEQGIKVIEFGAGRGRLSDTVAEKFPNSHFTATEYVDALKHGPTFPISDTRCSICVLYQSLQRLRMTGLFAMTLFMTFLIIFHTFNSFEELV